MKRGCFASLVAALFVLSMTARGADDTKTPATTPAKAPSTSDTGTTKLKGRLPPYYAKLPVDAKQREKIYEIEAEFSPKIKALHEQLAKLEADEAEQIKGVLTPEQQEKLKELMAEARKNRHKGSTEAAPKAVPPGKLVPSSAAPTAK